ncbi:TPA: LOW QUALITY PROTEIN: hypothetical protein N0F65_010144 [Lagenidium giganteum]|uniref:Uncharacterized protein n=1 Tax=Lagenidium giganteum TaxID=4803 RepID=A0AAV2Z6R0_9STRA|nr:TPA: LOW QUALITY PROTEIN: hypothetical protein N0F65_010144 [Lagenidium giganteum]
MTSFLHNVTFALRASHHSMLGRSPAQAAFGRDMMVDIEHVTDWAERHACKVKQIQQNNHRENAKRVPWDYRPDSISLLRGPYQIQAVRDNGTLVLDKGSDLETVSMRRVIPYKVQGGGECEFAALRRKKTRGQMYARIQATAYVRRIAGHMATRKQR